MSEIVKVEQGLLIPDDITEAEHRALGNELFVQHDQLQEKFKGNQWDVGDWYNKIAWGSKQKYCERDGHSFGYARACGGVAKSFELESNCGPASNLPHRSTTLTFTLHQEAANGTTPEQCAELIKWATVGLEEPAGHYRKPTKVELIAERKRMLGVVPVVKLKLSTDKEFDSALDSLPKAASSKAKKEFKRVINVARKQFHSEVRLAVDKGMEEDRARLREVRKKQVQRNKHLDAMAARINFFMTEEEFKIVLSCLHPDREAPKERKEKAFDIFNRLKAGLPKKAKWKEY